VAQKAEQIARRLGTQINNFIYKQIWRGVNVERWAVAAEEVRHDKPGQSRRSTSRGCASMSSGWQSNVQSRNALMRSP